MSTKCLGTFVLALAFSLSSGSSCGGNETYLLLDAGHRQQYLRATFSPDGRFVAVVGHVGNADSRTGGHLTIWELATREVVARITTFPMRCGRVKFSPDGKTIAVGDYCGTVYFYGFVPGDEKLLTPKGTLPGLRTVPRNRNQGPEEITFSPSGRLFAKTSNDAIRGSYRQRLASPQFDTRDHGIQCMMANGASPPTTFKPLSEARGRVEELHFLSEEQLLAAIYPMTRTPPKLFVLNAMKGTVDQRIDLNEAFSARPNIAVARDAPRFVVGCERLHVYSSDVKKVLARLPVAPTTATSNANSRQVAISPDGQRVATCFRKIIQIWDVDNETLVGSLTFPKQMAGHTGLEFSPDGSLLVCTSGRSILPIFRINQIIGDKPGPVFNAR